MSKWHAKLLSFSIVTKLSCGSTFRVSRSLAGYGTFQPFLPGHSFCSLLLVSEHVSLDNPLMLSSYHVLLCTIQNCLVHYTKCIRFTVSE